MVKVILASQSPYRKSLLGRLGIEFEALAPQIDEDDLKAQLLAKGNAPIELCQKLAEAKAESIFKSYPEAIVIGSDQLVDFKGQIIGKAHSIDRAVKQLLEMQNQEHRLLTSVAIFTPASQTPYTWINQAKLKMRPLSEAQVINYVNQDNPVDCAGSYKLEKGGIQLFEQIECSDWTAIEGLPLIEVSRILSLQGIL